VGKFAASIERQKVKSILSSGGLAPTLLIRGLYPWTLLGLRPHTPFIEASQ